MFFFGSIILAAATGITDLIPVTGDLFGVPNSGPPCSSCPMAPRPIEGTYLAANTSGMAKKPEPPQPTSWNVEKAAAEFSVDTWRLFSGGAERVTAMPLAKGSKSAAERSK